MIARQTGIRPLTYLKSIVAICVVLGLSGAAMAQSQGRGDSLDKARKQISELSIDLEARLGAAQKALEDVPKIGETSEAERILKERFDAIDADVKRILDQVALNSPFMDALDEARSRTIVLKNWFARQPADYPNRDRSIARLDAALQEYAAQAQRIRDAEKDANRALIEFGQIRSVIAMEMKIDTVEASVVKLKAFTDRLTTLVSKLKEVSAAETPRTDDVSINQN